MKSLESFDGLQSPIEVRIVSLDHVRAVGAVWDLAEREQVGFAVLHICQDIQQELAFDLLPQEP